MLAHSSSRPTGGDRTAQLLAMAAYACIASPYAYTAVAYGLARRFHHVHGVWPGPNVLPQASQAPYYGAMVMWSMAGWVLLPAGLVLLVSLGVVWKRPLAVPVVLWLLGTPLLALNWISDFTTWLAD